MAGWYVRRGEKVAGPVEVEKLKELVATGKLLPTDLLAKDIEGPWTEAGKTKLFVNVQQTPPANSGQLARREQNADNLRPLANPEPQLNALDPQAERASTSQITHAAKTAWQSLSRSLAVRAERKHEIKLAKISAKAVANSSGLRKEHSGPSVSHGAIPTAPQVVQTTTIVKVVNNNSSGCGCSGCLLLLLLGFLFFIVAAAINSSATTTP